MILNDFLVYKYASKEIKVLIISHLSNSYDFSIVLDLCRNLHKKIKNDKIYIVSYFIAQILN